MRHAIRAIRIRLFKRTLRNRAVRRCINMVVAGVVL
jgi:hypothetical protein